MQSKKEKVGKYVLDKELGRGAFGVVYKAIDSTNGSVYAIKKLVKKNFLNPLMKRLLETEIQIMREINHPNILHLFEFLQSKEHYYLVLQYCNQGDFEHYLQSLKKSYLNETEAVGFLKQIMNGFTELRKQQILHRDFKLENLFMNDGVLVIGDFGLSKKGAEMTSTKVGTPLTMAPELLFDDSETPYTSKADLWSIGCVYYQMLCSEPPFFGLSIPELKADIKAKLKEGLKFKYPVSTESKDLINRLLCFDAKNRIEWKDFFGHELFKKQDTQQTRDFLDVFKAIKDIGIGQKSKIDEEFQANQNQHQQQSKAVNPHLRPIEDIPLYSINAKEIDERTTDVSDFFDFKQNEELNNLKKHYLHENNKILFIDFTVQKVRRLLGDPIYQALYSPLSDLALLLCRKSLVLNNGIVWNLINHNNFLNKDPHAFSVFSNSFHENEIAAAFNKERASLEQVFGELVQWQKASGFKCGFEPLVFDSNANLQLIDQNLQFLFNALKGYALTKLNDLSLYAYKQELMNILVCVVKAVMSETSFPFLPDPAQPDCKFNWPDFYNYLSKMTYQEMLANI